MAEIRVFVLPFDPIFGSFDDSPVVQWLMTRELRSHTARFFEHQGRPYWTIVVEAEPMQSVPATIHGAKLGCRVYPGIVRLDRGSKHRLRHKLLSSLKRIADHPETAERETNRLCALVAYSGIARTAAFRRSILFTQR